MGPSINGLQLANIQSTHLEQVKSWILQHPTTAKVSKMAGLILGIGLLMAPFFIVGFGIPVKTFLAITGGALVTAVLKSEIIPVNLPPRKYPPVSLLDTVKITINDQGKRIVGSAHGARNIFEDKEIIAYHPILRKELLGECMDLDTGKKENIYIDFTQNNKAIIQQQATRGCTAATAAMLIKDRGGKLDFSTLQLRNLGNHEYIKQDIRVAGFEPVVTQFESNSLEALREQLKNYGSAIVSIVDPRAGAHSIVVDEVSKNLSQVRLRDPYHGWEITVSAAAFQSRWTSLDCKVIQIESEASISKKDHSCKRL